ncbi:MAG: polysaccharide biosynthesis/export family protein [Paludibacteraceae bacterium]|nr:polysaccharide biosynthesis/export family protein [Paludibacteraceae bacterium]MBR6686688.1 polysaccharide biosynthesis/export family protein [Paludibacteraceae bacterium]
MKYLKLNIILLMALFVASCVTPRKTHYLQEPDKYVPNYPEYHTPADYNIQISDELHIRVITLDPESQKLFNASTGSSTSLSSSYKGLYTYTVYDDGTIDFPYIGSIHVANLTTRQIKHKIEAALKDYVKDCSVEVRLVNNYFNLITERSASRHKLNKEKMNIFEALAVGGDLGPYSDRKHVKVLRQLPSGETEIKEFDIRSKEILESEYYYIQPNDIIYVKAFQGQFFRVNSFLTAIGVTSATISFGLLVYQIVKLCIPNSAAE